MEPSYFHKDFDSVVVSDIPESLFDIIVVDIDGNEICIGEYFKDKNAVLIVNVASNCGFTDSNYTQLVRLSEKYKDLQILAFPCNQFAEEESLCNLEIKQNMKNKFGVNFPMFSKIEVNGPNTNPLYLYLKSKTEYFNKNDGNLLKNVGWNFSKFLLDGNGNIINYYNPYLEPDIIIPDIEKKLNSN